MSYYILSGDWSIMANEASIPRVEDRPSDPDFFLDLWQTDPILERWSQVTISITRGTPRANYLMTSSGIEICDSDFINQLKEVTDDFEYLPVTVIDRHSKVPIKKSYYVLHPLKSFPSFDLTKSSRRSSGKIKKLAPSKELIECSLPLIRDEEHWLILVDDQIRNRFEKSKLIGCRLIDLEKYPYEK